MKRRDQLALYRYASALLADRWVCRTVAAAITTLSSRGWMSFCGQLRKVLRATRHKHLAELEVGQIVAALNDQESQRRDRRLAHARH